MLSFLKNIFGGPNLSPLVDQINSLEDNLAQSSDEQLKAQTESLKSELKNGETLESLLPRAFALVREAAKRTLRQRHFDVQLMGGIVLHRSGIAEMMTGEGKTLASTSPVYLNALLERGAHVVTVNEYLAKRDTVLMGQIYHALGLKVSCLIHEGALMYDPQHTSESALLDKERDTTGTFLVQEEYLRPISRREAYAADITYGTNHEFGFDYLRDNLAYSLENQVQRGHYFAIVDEADSILIDEARTPLIIAAPDSQSSEFYKVFAGVSSRLAKDTDYMVDEKMKSVSITDEGINKVENLLHLKNIYSPENFRLVHYLEESLKAQALYLLDRDYVVKEGTTSSGRGEPRSSEREVIIVDQYTGRLMLGRRYSGGLHQAIEAKEHVSIKEESQTYARISIQNYFRLYEKLAGMTGTAQTSAEEFHKVYGLDVVSIPPNKPLVRKDSSDLIYRTLEEKYNAVVREVRERYDAGQPVLLGTPSIEKNEVISQLLTNAGVPHELLNAKNNEREGAIIAQAGRPKAVMVATNVAGRGVDIILGGNPQDPKAAAEVREAGGLHVIGTERHEARRIDNQLRGRAGRQGDPGSSQFFLSLEDDLMRVFGGERIQNLMSALNMPKDMPIESGFVSKAVTQAQAKVEGLNFDGRKHLLEYDDVLNKQRLGFYTRRQSYIANFNKEELKQDLLEIVRSEAEKFVGQVTSSELTTEWTLDMFREVLVDSKIIKSADEVKDLIEKVKTLSPNEGRAELTTFIESNLDERVVEAVNDASILGKILGILDMLWMTHLENIESLSESVRLRAYAQHDPLVEYRREGHRLYQELFQNFNSWVFLNLFRSLQTQTNADSTRTNADKSVSTPFRGKEIGGGVAGDSASMSKAGAKEVGRNEPCPCGAINPVTGNIYKYKHCGLINASHHIR